jgi:copper chaperone NosL
MPWRRRGLWLALAGAATVVAVAAWYGSRGREAARPVGDVPIDLCIHAPATPFDPASGLNVLDPRAVPAQSRCPVCGMYPARYARWAAQVILRDGAAHFFDSPIDLFAFLQNINRYDRRYGPADAAAVFVKDLESGEWINARQAFFLHGSSLAGPMRDADLPAFASRAAAARRYNAHGGKVLAYDEITPELIRPLNRNVHHRHEQQPAGEK